MLNIYNLKTEIMMNHLRFYHNTETDSVIWKQLADNDLYILVWILS